MTEPQRRTNQSGSTDLGEWTVMGIVKRLDDQKRMIDSVRRELEELKSTEVGGASRGEGSLQPSQLAQNIETALEANKHLTDSVIKLKQIVSHLVAENERLKEQVEAIKAGRPLGAIPSQQGHRLSDVHLRMLRAIDAEAKSSTEISRMIGRSREHTSRMMRTMVEQGILEQQTQEYIPKYALTREGKALLRICEDRSLREDAIP